MERLARQVAWLWVVWSISFGALLLMLVMVICGVITVKELRARHLVVVDDKGTPRIALTMQPTHVVELVRKGETFPIRYVETALVSLCDPQGQQRISLKTGGEGSVEVVLYDRQGKARIGLTATELPSITLYDPEGRGRLALSLSGDGQPHLRLYGPNWEVLYEAPASGTHQQP